MTDNTGLERHAEAILRAVFAGGDALSRLFEKALPEYLSDPAILAACQALRDEGRREGIEAAAKRDHLQIGDKVQIIPETAGMEWQGEPPHFITGIDWHLKHGVTYTTSEVWPPKCAGLFVEGLTDEWLSENLREIKEIAPAKLGDA